ncbi:hypothetical protein ACFLWE_01230 [Chloroflexota bacterium]
MAKATLYTTARIKEYREKGFWDDTRSRAIIDVCKPYEWNDEFHQEITISPELKERVLNKFKDIIK